MVNTEVNGELFGVDVRTVSEHLKNIIQSNELNDDLVIRKFRRTATDGKSYNTQFYNLDAIISVGYRVNSKRSKQTSLRKIPMTMEDWTKRLNLFLEFNERDILHDSGQITAKLVKDHAESEFEKYRIVQDRLFESDFDKLISLQNKESDE